MNTDDTDQEKPKPLKQRNRGTEEIEDREIGDAENSPLMNTDDTDQEKPDYQRAR
jgi:hypothetical protein